MKLLVAGAAVTLAGLAAAAWALVTIGNRSHDSADWRYAP